MVDSDLRMAKKLMDEAWVKRAKAMESPPDSTAELEAIAESVKNDLTEAVRICRAHDAHRELCVALRRLAHANQDTGQLDNALALNKEATEAARKTQDQPLIAHAVRHIGDIHRNAGRTDDALDCYDEALAIYRSLETPPKLDYANALRPMAILKEETKATSEAIELWKAAGNLYGEIGIDAGVQEAQAHLAQLTEN